MRAPRPVYSQAVHRFTLTPYPGFALAWSDEWPGMVAGARDAADLAWQVPLTIAEYRAWLERHGEDGPADGPWAPGAELRPGPVGTDADPCYPADVAPLSRLGFDRFLRHSGLAQRDLARAAALPDALLDWLPKGLTAEHADPWAPDPRTIRGIVTHALQLEVFYRDALRDGPAAGIFEPVGPVEAEQARTIEALQQAASGGLDRVFRPQRGSGSAAEWTLRKVFRRLISHNRQHAWEIEQRRSWVVLGVPSHG